MKIEILPGLWISKKSFSENAEFLRDKNIGFLVNCEKDLEFLGKSSGYSDEIRVNIEKYEILPKELVAANEQRLNMFHDTQKIKDLVKSKYYLINKKKLLIVIFTLTITFIFLILKIYRKK